MSNYRDITAMVHYDRAQIQLLDESENWGKPAHYSLQIKTAVLLDEKDLQ